MINLSDKLVTSVFSFLEIIFLEKTVTLTCKRLASVVRSDRCRLQMRALDLSYANIVRYISDKTVSRMCVRYPNLTYLNINSQSKVSDTGVLMITFHCKRLTSINIGFTGASVLSFVTVALHCRELRHLNVDRLKYPESKAIKTEMCLNLATPYLTKLRSLSVNSTGLTTAQVVRLIKKCKHLKDLSIQNQYGSMFNHVMQAVIDYKRKLKTLHVCSTIKGINFGTNDEWCLISKEIFTKFADILPDCTVFAGDTRVITPEGLFSNQPVH